MAKRERERYTERTRPHRRDAPHRGGLPVSSDGWGNPIVLVAAGGLVLALVLAVGFAFGSRNVGQPTAAVPDESSEVEVAATTAADASVVEATARPAVPTPPANFQQYSAPEDQGLDPETKAYFATIETTYGPIVFEMWPEVAPQTVNSFVFLAREGFYDGLTFHRVVDGFVIQGGDPLGTGTGGPGYSIPAEFMSDNPVPHRIGTVAMARSQDPDSAGSQFYIVTADSENASNLDGQYTVFGHVISGMDAVLKVAVGDVMTSVTIEEKPIAERVVSPDDIRNGLLPDYGELAPEAADSGDEAGAAADSQSTGEESADAETGAPSGEAGGTGDAAGGSGSAGAGEAGSGAGDG